MNFFYWNFQKYTQNNLSPEAYQDLHILYIDFCGRLPSAAGYFQILANLTVSSFSSFQDKNGILESPTGTGKTLCLLCSALGWLESRKAQCELNKQVGIADMLSEGGRENVEQRTLKQLTQALSKATGSATWGSNEYSKPQASNVPLGKKSLKSCSKWPPWR